MPELFIVGAQRSGTTYLHEMLDAHPQVCMARPVRPEPKYFLDSCKYAEGKEYYETRYFRGRSNESVYVGEKSTSYIEFKVVAERIRSFYPNARIFIILRDPVERAFSNYRFSVAHGIEKLSFADGLAAESARSVATEFTTSVNPYAYQQRGHYINYLKNYSQVFDRKQIHVLIHEEFIGNCKAISDVYSWLGIERSFVPDCFNDKINAGTDSSLDSPELQKCKSDLRKTFVDSNKRLEEYLERKIDVWGH